MMRQGTVLFALLAFGAVSVAQDDSKDLKALQGLAACVQAHAGKSGYVQGWGTSSGGTADASAPPGSTAAVNAQIEANNEQLIAMGVPGVTQTTGIATDTTGTNPCGSPVPWSGIICQNNRVTQLQMGQLGPNALPCNVANFSGLSGLDQLVQLSFIGTGLYGQLPDSWSSGFGKLQMMNLQQNSLTGTLPSSWSNGFGALTDFSVEHNKIGGSLPSSWGSAGAFGELRSFDVASNKFTGSLPAYEGGWPLLQLFEASTNKLNGSLPTSWGNSSFGSLSNLELEDNNLTGCLPYDWPSQLTNLSTIRISNNSLQGPFPDSWDEWESLSLIEAFPGNSFCGNISAQLAQEPPNSQGRVAQGSRFQPAPSSYSPGQGFSLGSCNSDSC